MLDRDLSHPAPVRERGFTLITAAVSSLALIGMTGLAFDLGRVYITRNELQAYVDAAALSAAQQLNSTNAGLNNAVTAARNTLNRWNFATKVVDPNRIDVDFSLPDPAGGTNFTWVSAPNPPGNYSIVRVRAVAPLPLTFIRVVYPNQAANVSATAVAGQVPKSSFKQGIFPFSPFAHTFSIGLKGAQMCGSVPQPGCQDPTTGLIIGDQYTLRWPANPNLGHGNYGTGSNMCPGDRSGGTTIVNIANQAGGSERGYIENTSASVIRQTIVDDYQSVVRTVGDLVTMTGGAKQSQATSLDERILQDTDQTSIRYSQYTGNERRIVACIINDGVLVNANQYTAIQIGAFLLLPNSSYGTGGNQAWCAEYLGPFCQGCKNGSAGTSGAYVVRLIL